jgi:hypothetical protein
MKAGEESTVKIFSPTLAGNGNERVHAAVNVEKILVTDDDMDVKEMASALTNGAVSVWHTNEMPDKKFLGR